MKLARCTAGDPRRAFWAAIDLEGLRARPIAGPLARWAPALTSRPGSAPPWAGDPISLDGIRLLAPLEPAAKVVATGATYVQHIADLGLEMPEHPVVFLRPIASIIGPEEAIAYPAVTTALDYEAELVAVVGREVGDEGPGAITAILGYTIGNDVSARDLQFAGGVAGMDLFSAKALDGTGPVGPWIVTRDELGGDLSPDLELKLTIDGELRQRDRTSSLAWPVGELVSYVAARSRMHAGDALFTGTCAGVGHEDGRYLEPGQEVLVSIEGIGELRNRVGPRPV